MSARRWDARTVRTVILEIRASDAVTICRRTDVNQTAGAGRTVNSMTDKELFGNSEQLESSHFADPGNMVGDLISRAKAINAICEDGTQLERRGQYTMTMAERKQRDADILDALPSAQPTDEDIQRMQDIEQAMLEKAYWFGKQDAQQWIPTSERLPKVREWVLCQCRAGIMDVLRLTEDGSWNKNYPHAEYMSGFVIAWMPLPEPWKGEEHGTSRTVLSQKPVR